MKLSPFEMDLLTAVFLQSIEDQKKGIAHVAPGPVKDRLQADLDNATQARRDLLAKIRQNVTVG